MNLIKGVFFQLDKFVYAIASYVYQIFYYIADARILDSELIEIVYNRMFAIISIGMIFVVAFNLLTYIVDPDKMSDKKTGASTLIKDVIIALVLIITMPTIFNYLYALQADIIGENVIANVLLGGYTETDTSLDCGDEDITSCYASRGADIMVANVFAAFLTPADSELTVLDCNGTTMTSDSTYNAYCSAYQSAKNGAGLSSFSSLYTSSYYDYTFIFSTAAGVVLVFFMLSFCINLAKRAGKLALLQIIAPAPLIMEVLPNKKGTRSTWLNMLIKTYCEVFIYEAVVLLTVFLIALLPDVISSIFANATEGFSFLKLVALIILIYGLLQFGKEAPKLILDLLGLQSTGVIGAAASRALNMGKRTAAYGAYSKNLVGGMAQNAANNFNETEGNKRSRVGSAFAGATSYGARMVRGIPSIKTIGDSRGLRATTTQTVQSNRVERDRYSAQHGGTFRGTVAGHINDRINDVDASVHDWAHMGGYTVDTSELDAIKKIKGYTDAAGVKYSDDAGWQQLNSDFRATLDNDFYNGFNSYRKQYGNSKTIDDYVNHLNTSDDTRKKYASVISTYEQRVKKEEEMQEKNANKRLVAANQAIKILSEDKLIGDLSYMVNDENGNPQKKLILDDFQALIDPNTHEIRQGHNDEELREVFTKYNKALKERENAANLRVANQKIEADARKAREDAKNNK